MLCFVFVAYVFSTGQVYDALVQYKAEHGNLHVPVAFQVPSCPPWSEDLWGLAVGQRSVKEGRGWRRVGRCSVCVCCSMLDACFLASISVFVSVPDAHSHRYRAVTSTTHTAVVLLCKCTGSSVASKQYVHHCVD